MKREKSVTKANVDLIVGNCLANQALEGLVCTPEDEAACRRIVTGETTLDQELAPILAKYQKGEMTVITPERMEELDRAWNDSDSMDDQEYREWYEDLTEEEQALIDSWDKQYTKGVLRICEEILDKSRKADNIGN